MSDISDLQGKAKVNEWLQGIYSKDIATQKSEIKTLFTQIQENNLTEEQKAGMLESKNSLEATVEKLEAEMAVLEEEIAAVQDKVNEMSEEAANLLASIHSKSDKIEESQKKTASDVVADVLAKKKRDPEYGVNQMVADMRSGMSKFANNSEYKNLQNDITTLTGKEQKIAELLNSVSGLITRKDNLEKRYGATKSTYDLIKGNLESTALTDASFTNIDKSVDKPIFSATKLETLVPFFDNTAVNVEAGENAKYKRGTKAPNPTEDSINTKYKDYLKTEKTKDVDGNSIENQAVKNLKTAIEKGLLTDLKMAGVTGDKLVNFLTENFAGANIKKADDGTLKIPYGHGQEAKAVFKGLTDFVQAQTIGDDPSKWSSDYFKGVENTWDKNKGNTIDTNNQIKALNENFDTIAAGMLEKGFTFKEAMYAMFNPENGLFKDSGIIYDVNKQKDGIKYFMEYAGDDKTAEAYKNIATTIYKNWGVKPTMCIDYDNIDNETPQGGKNVPVETYRTDPLTFVDGDTEYSFIVDRDSDNRFDGKNEFLGGDGSKSWLDDLKALDANNDGVLNGDELQNLKILKSKIKDNAQTAAYGNVKSETTTIGYEFTTAKDLGIEEINLKNLKADQKTGKTDANNSEIFNDSFKFKLNGKEITARRKDDTEEYMKTVYGNTYGVRFDGLSGLTEEEINNIVDQDYNKINEFSTKFKDFDNNVKVLQGFSSALEETKDYVNKAETRSDNESNAIIIRGQNKAQSLYGRTTNWETMKEDVIRAAQARGIDTSDSDFLTQTRGLYILNGTLNAEGLVDEYQKLQEMVNSSETRRKNAPIAFDGLIACAKAGLSPKLDDIFKIMEEGKVSTADEIVEYYKAQAPEENQAEEQNENQ